MAEAMVTGRMSSEKKARASRVLSREGLNASQVINLLYDRLIDDGDARCITGSGSKKDAAAWRRAAQFVDALSEPKSARFDSMTKAEIRVDRLRARGLM